MYPAADSTTRFGKPCNIVGTWRKLSRSSFTQVELWKSRLSVESCCVNDVDTVRIMPVSAMDTWRKADTTLSAVLNWYCYFLRYPSGRYTALHDSGAQVERCVCWLLTAVECAATRTTGRQLIPPHPQYFTNRRSCHSAVEQPSLHRPYPVVLR